MTETAAVLTLAERAAGRAAVELAGQIRAWRKRAGLSQPQLAERVGYTSSYVARVECPERGLPSEIVVSAIDQVLGAGGALVALRRRAKAERDELHAVLAAPRLTVESELSLTVRVRIEPGTSGNTALASAWLQVAAEAIRRAGDLDGDPTSAEEHRADIPAQLNHELFLHTRSDN